TRKAWQACSAVNWWCCLTATTSLLSIADARPSAPERDSVSRFAAAGLEVAVGGPRTRWQSDALARGLRWQLCSLHTIRTQSPDDLTVGWRAMVERDDVT